ncbi:hypothetical protein Tco_0052560 [Tanacetum coccineum]
MDATSKLPSLIGIRSISKEARETDTEAFYWLQNQNNTLLLVVGLKFPSSDGPHLLHILQHLTVCKISPEGFMSSVLLWLVIIVMVISIDVTIVVVESSSVIKLLNLAIVGHYGAISWNLLQIRLAIHSPSLSVGKIRLPSLDFCSGNSIMDEYDSSLPLPLEVDRLAEHELFVCSIYCLAIGASVGLVVLSVFAMLVACASRAAVTLSATSFLMAA